MSYWTDKYFGSLYHEIYSQHLLDPQRALEEAAFASHVLELGRRTILDVACGFGRHARLLAQSNRVIAIDRSRHYLQAARTDLPPRPAANLFLAQSDMRQIPLRDKSIDAAVMLFNSFGYFGADDDNAITENPTADAPKRQVWKLPSVFYERQLVDTTFGKFKDPAPTTDPSKSETSPDESTTASLTSPHDPNRLVLREIYRTLKPGAGLLLELPNKRTLLQAVEENPRRLMVLEGYEVHEQFEWNPATSRLVNRTKFVADDREEPAGYSLRLYEPDEIKQALAETGFRLRRTYGDYEGSRFGPASSDVLLLHATRPVRNKA